ncbi:MAG: OB-fold protein [Bacteroidota bacterium]
MKGKTIFLIVAFGLIILFLSTYLYIKKNNLAESDADFRISAQELFTKYSENTNEANKKYRNKILEVTGVVDAVNIVSNNVLDPVIEITDPHLTLRTQNPSASIFCTFNEKFRMNPVPVSENEIITVKGICKGMLLTDVRLEECIIVESSR